jgi:hypothetical protein
MNFVELLPAYGGGRRRGQMGQMLLFDPYSAREGYTGEIRPSVPSVPGSLLRRIQHLKDVTTATGGTND